MPKSYGKGEGEKECDLHEVLSETKGGGRTEEEDSKEDNRDDNNDNDDVGDDNNTSREILEQLEASRISRFGHARETSRRVSSVTYAQLEMFKDVSSGQAIAAARTPASESL